MSTSNIKYGMRDAEMQRCKGRMQTFFITGKIFALSSWHLATTRAMNETTVWVRLAESSVIVALLSLGGLEKLYRVSMSRKAS